MSLATALIHTARIVSRARASTRNGYGEFAEAETEGPTFAARLMSENVQRKVPQPGAHTAQGDVAERTVARYEVLAGPEDEEGNDLVIKTTDRIRFIEGGPLGDLTLDVDGKPELLNNGREKIGWRCFAVLVEDA